MNAQHFTDDCARITSTILRAPRVAANLWRFSHDFYATTCIHVFFRLRLSAPCLKSVGGLARAHPKKMPIPRMRLAIPDAPRGLERCGDFPRFPDPALALPRIPKREFTSENASIHDAVPGKGRRVAHLGKSAIGPHADGEKPFGEGRGGAFRARGTGRGLSKNNRGRPLRPKRPPAAYLKKMLNRRDTVNGFVTSLPRAKTGQRSHRKFRTRARSGIILAAIWKNEASPS
jgi:hypothetical protein